MKKIITGFLCILVAFVFLVNSVVAAVDESKIKASYDHVHAYYKDQENVLYSPEDVIAANHLGFNLHEDFTLVNDMMIQDFSSLPAGTLSKYIIAFSLMGIHPNEVNGYHLVDMLEAKVSVDGDIQISPTDIAAPNFAVWCLFALTTVDSANVVLVADALADKQLTNGAFWYEYSGIIADEAITGWVIEALANIDKDKYKVTIEKAISYLNSVQQSDGSWGAWGASADTQAAVLQGLLAYDPEGVKAGKYDKDGASPYDTLFTLQDSATGGFGYIDWSSKDFVLSNMSTYNASISIGSYFHGSFVLSAKAAYSNLPSNPIISTEEEVNTTGPLTRDQTHLIRWVCLLFASMALMFLVNKNYAKI